MITEITGGAKTLKASELQRGEWYATEDRVYLLYTLNYDTTNNYNCLIFSAILRRRAYLGQYELFGPTKFIQVNQESLKITAQV